jgi:hypothetical protein
MAHFNVTNPLATSPQGQGIGCGTNAWSAGYTNLTAALAAATDKVDITLQASTSGLFALEITKGLSDTLVGHIFFSATSQTKYLRLLGLPLHFDAGVRIRGRTASDSGGRTLYVNIVAHEVDPSIPTGAEYFDSYPAVDPASLGTAYATVTCGHNAWGSAAALGTTDEAYGAIIVYGRDTTSGGATTALARLAAASTVIGGHAALHLTNGDPMPFVMGPVREAIASGAALEVQGACGSATVNTFRCSALAFPVPAVSPSGTTIIESQSMSRQIRRNESSAAMRRIPIPILATDGTPFDGDPDDIDGAGGGLKAWLSQNYGTETLSPANLVKKAPGDFYVEPTQAYTDVAEGTILRARVDADVGLGYRQAYGQAEVIPADSYAAQITQPALVTALFRALNGADGYGVELDESNNQLKLTIPSVGVVTVAAQLVTSRKAIKKVGA